MKLEYTENNLLINDLPVERVASGVTSGTSTALTLAFPGFVLEDGAVVRVRLHTALGEEATLNVNGTGALDIVTPTGDHAPEGLVEGSWLTAVYSSENDNFTLQGEGGGGGGSGGGGGYGVDGVTERFVYSDDEAIHLKWKDPPDFVVDEVPVVEWDHTDLVRKVNSHPITEKDGLLIVRNSVRDAYNEDPFSDEDVEGGVKYCYGLFPVSKDGVITVRKDGRLRAWLGGVSGPGPQVLLGGDIDAGFYGECSADDLITGDDLALAVGLDKTGKSQYSDAGWLKFAFDSKTLFVAKKPIRHTISWNHLNTAKAVYGDAGDATVLIDGLTYKVRLLRGADVKFDPKSRIDQQDGGGNGYSGAVNHYSEWNRLMLPIHQEAISRTWSYPDNVEADIPVWAHTLGTGTSSRYKDADLLTSSSYGNGAYSWCQEMTTSTSNRLIRGYFGVSRAGDFDASYANTNYGWRPVLELVD